MNLALSLEFSTESGVKGRVWFWVLSLELNTDSGYKFSYTGKTPFFYWLQMFILSKPFGDYFVTALWPGVPLYRRWRTSRSACWAEALTAWPTGRWVWAGLGLPGRRRLCGWWWWPGSRPSRTGPPAYCRWNSRAAAAEAGSCRTSQSPQAPRRRTSCG